MHRLQDTMHKGGSCLGGCMGTAARIMGLTASIAMGVGVGALIAILVVIAAIVGLLLLLDWAVVSEISP